MARIAGRSDDMMIVRGVNVFPSQIEEQILKCVALTGHYEIELTRPNRLDEVLIKVESRDYLSQGEGEAIGAELANMLKTTVGITTAVEVVGPETIARSTGKAVHVFDRR
jgi:phenylacetate-CoA ligase